MGPVCPGDSRSCGYRKIELNLRNKSDDREDGWNSVETWSGVDTPTTKPPVNGYPSMLLSSIRTRLLGLVIATVIPFTALIGAGLWNQWRIDQASAIERALNEARLLAAQVDDHIGNLDNLMMGLSRAVSANPADVLANDALLQKVKAELPGFVSNVLVFAPDGSNIGTSADPSHGRPSHGAPISSKSSPVSISASATPSARA